MARVISRCAAYLCCVCIGAGTAQAQGVRTVDAGLAVRNQAANARREGDLAVQREKLTVKEQIAEIEGEQLRVLQQILDAQTSFGGQGIPGTIDALEAGASASAICGLSLRRG